MSLSPLPSTGFTPRHTPTPWILSTSPSDHHEHSIDIIGENTHIITIHGCGDRAERNANAALIADAPTLLYHVRNLADAITHAEQTKDWHDLLKYREQALRAIQKHLQPSAHKDAPPVFTPAGP